MDPDDLTPRARKILDAAREADDPTDVDRERIDAAFGARLRALGVTAPPAPAAPHRPAPDVREQHEPSAGRGLSSASKIALAALGATMVAIGLSQVSRTNAPAHAPAPAAAAPAPSAHPLEQNAPVAASLSPVDRTTPPAPAPSPPLSPARAAADNPRSARPRARPKSDLLREEIALIESANAALRQARYAAALSVLDTHTRRFAQGALREERLGLRVLALCGLGDYAEGTAARREFLRDARHSVLARKVRGACAPADSADVGGRHDQTE